MDYVADQIVLNLKQNRTGHIKIFCKKKHHAHSFIFQPCCCCCLPVVRRPSAEVGLGCAEASGNEGALLPRGWRRSGSSEWARGSGAPGGCLLGDCTRCCSGRGLADSISSPQGPVLVSACPIAHDFSDPARSEGAAAASLAAALSRIATPISSDLNTSPTSPVAIIPCLTRKKSNAYTPVFSLSNYTVPTSHGDILLQLFGQGRGGVDHGCTEVHPLAAGHRGCNEDSLTKPRRRSGSPRYFYLFVSTRLLCIFFLLFHLMVLTFF